MIVGMRGALHKTFLIGIVWKGVEGAFELVMSVLLYFTKVETLRGTLIGRSLTHLSYDPTDWFWSHVLTFAQSVSLPGKLFATAYLFAHGVLRIFMFVTLLENKRWSYPVSIVLLFLFFVYQCIHLAMQWSLGLAVLSTVDPALLVLVWIEFRARYGTKAHLFRGALT